MTGDHPPATHEPDRQDRPPPSPPPPPDTGPEPQQPGMPPKPETASGDPDPVRAQREAEEAERTGTLSRAGDPTDFVPDPAMTGEA